jgi:hypothetical protein
MPRLPGMIQTGRHGWLRILACPVCTAIPLLLMSVKPCTSGNKQQQQITIAAGEKKYENLDGLNLA